MNWPTNRQCRGFTIVELLAVIAIVALLVSILLSSLSKVRRAAASVQCLSQLRQIGQLTFQYVSENGGIMPIDNGAATDPDGSGPLPNIFWFAQRGASSIEHVWQFYSVQYLAGGGKNLFWCPEVPRGVYPLTLINPDDLNESTKCTYGVSGYTCGGSAASRDCVWSFRKTNVSPETYNPRKLMLTKNAAERLMVGDTGLQNVSPGAKFGGIIKRGYSLQFMMASRHGPTGPLSKRYVNFVCADGHTESRPFGEVQQMSPTMIETEQNITGWNWLGPH